MPYLVFVALLFSIPLANTNAAPAALPHFDLEMSSEEMARVVGSRLGPQTITPESIQAVQAMGRRNLEWIRFMNQSRPEGAQLSFTSEATQRGIPIYQPNIYSPSIIEADFVQLRADMPEEMKRVIFDGASFTATPPIAEELYREWGLNAERLYDIANRWQRMEPFLWQLEGRRWMDVRGHYWLTREPDLNTKLSAWTALPDPDKTRLRPWLLGICLNSRRSQSSCQSELSSGERAGDLAPYHAKYAPGALALWNDFFRLDVRRSDSQWSLNPFEVKFPFQDPRDAAVRDFLLNIEDEWQMPNWNLRLDFRPSGNIPYVTFVAGATPNVNGLGGNRITMDANQPLTEYNVRWTIRHEFGHVLGYKDCYIEFYDSSAQAIVNYQLDVGNLMCSRRGKLMDSHLNELLRVYNPPRP